MPTFSRNSLEQLQTCHPDLQALFSEVIKTFDCQVLEGFRNQAKQETAFKAGNTQLPWPKGKHNKFPSMAVDVSPYPVEWDKINRFYWFAGFVIGTAIRLKQEGRMTMNVRYGGDWNRNYEIDDNHFNDLVHFELVP